MKKTLSSVLLSATLLVSLTTNLYAAGPFWDIEKSWAKRDILNAYSEGYVSGYPDGTFRPNYVVTTEEFLSILIRSLTEKDSNNNIFWKGEFFDSLDQDTKNYLIELYGTFKLKPEGNGYWADGFNKQAVNMYLVKKNDEVFREGMSSYLTREQAAYIVGNFLMGYESEESEAYLDLSKSKFKDFSKIRIETQRGVKYSVVKGIMTGYPEGDFRPTKFLTRAEAVIIAEKLSNKSKRLVFSPNLSGQYSTVVERNGERKTVVFKSKEFYDASSNLASIVESTDKLIIGDQLYVNFFDSQTKLDQAKQNIEFDLTYNGLSPLSFGLDRGESSYKISIDASSEYFNNNKKEYDEFTNSLFGTEKSKFDVSLDEFIKTYKSNGYSSVPSVTKSFYGRSINMISVKDSKKVIAFISEKRN